MLRGLSMTVLFYLFSKLSPLPPFHMATSIPTATYHLGQYQEAVANEINELNKKNFTAGFWQKEATLWTDNAEAQESIRSFMGWLRVAETMQQAVPEITDFVREVNEAGFQHVVVMGMGGSTMAPIVFEKSFPGSKGLPLSILDTTDPGTVQQIEQSVPLDKTLFIVASKSGTTAEPLAFGDYFYAKLKEIKGDKAGENFVAITDPGSKFVTNATNEGYRKIFLNFAEVGGRFSALTYFGLVPAALYGIDIAALLDRAVAMMQACGSNGAVTDNPGLQLGATMGVLSKAGRDKLTLVVPEALHDLGLWLEQLLAESTGKEGKGVLPVAGEPLADPSVYGNDRLFVYVGYENTPDTENRDKLKALEAAGHPVVTILMNEPLDLGAEFFRWEVGTATAGAVLRINPFDQPNVQESKTATDRVMKVVQEQGHLPAGPAAAATENGVSYFTDAKGDGAVGTLAAFFVQAQPGNFVCLQAYLTESAEVSQELLEFRQLVQQHLHVATTSGYGPRFLHSTGQFHKGGPNTGLFVQFTHKSPVELPLPGRSYSFGTFENAQAQGDLETLQQYKRRTLHIDLGSDAAQSLRSVLAALKQALAK
jgi:transaldolase/glucose-6-phosphate isomerase